MCSLAKSRLGKLQKMRADRALFSLAIKFANLQYLFNVVQIFFAEYNKYLGLASGDI